MKKIQINVNEDVYEEYQELCRQYDTSVAVELRRFMREEVRTMPKIEGNVITFTRDSIASPELRDALLPATATQKKLLKKKRDIVEAIILYAEYHGFTVTEDEKGIHTDGCPSEHHAKAVSGMWDEFEEYAKSV